MLLAIVFIVAQTRRYPIYVSNRSFFQSRVRFVSAHKINFGMEKMIYTNTNHKFVFVYHKHKKSFGIAPHSQRLTAAATKKQQLAIVSIAD
jgi:hypothetical protein